MRSIAGRRVLRGGPFRTRPLSAPFRQLGKKVCKLVPRFRPSGPNRRIQFSLVEPHSMPARAALHGDSRRPGSADALKALRADRAAASGREIASRDIFRFQRRKEIRLERAGLPGSQRNFPGIKPDSAAFRAVIQLDEPELQRQHLASANRAKHCAEDSSATWRADPSHLRPVLKSSDANTTYQG